MSYTKTNWENGAVPAINADNLNHMEQGIYDANEGVADCYTKSESDAKYRTKTEIDKYNGTFNSAVDLLSGHWSSTSAPGVAYEYTAPADGFVSVTRASDAPSSGSVSVHPSALSGAARPIITADSSTGTNVMSLYVKKGTVLYVSALAPTASYKSKFIATFFPYKTV